MRVLTGIVSLLIFKVKTYFFRIHGHIIGFLHCQHRIFRSSSKLRGSHSWWNTRRFSTAVSTLPSQCQPLGDFADRLNTYTAGDLSDLANLHTRIRSQGCRRFGIIGNFRIHQMSQQLRGKPRALIGWQVSHLKADTRVCGLVHHFFVVVHVGTVRTTQRIVVVHSVIKPRSAGSVVESGSGAVPVLHKIVMLALIMSRGHDAQCNLLTGKEADRDQT
mmetsp:Transcript_19833/g.56308  ORF Transcript_19833/g.56308 Transcript_19833/m.56308 type:complete len:218 (-) Transcript_19833:243-896(-)